MGTCASEERGLQRRTRTFEDTGLRGPAVLCVDATVQCTDARPPNFCAAVETAVDCQSADLHQTASTLFSDARRPSSSPHRLHPQLLVLGLTSNALRLRLSLPLLVSCFCVCKSSRRGHRAP